MTTSPLMSGLASWATGRTQRQADRWRQRSATLGSSLPAWRTEKRTLLLIRIFLGTLVFGVITGVAQIFWSPLLFAWLPFTIVACTSWTMLRTVINARDVAPTDELDEYENEVVRTGQTTAYALFTNFTLVIAFYMVFLPVFNPDGLDRWIYTGGLFTTLGLMAIIAIPTITYASTFGPVPTPEDAGKNDETDAQHNITPPDPTSHDHLPY